MFGKTKVEDIETWRKAKRQDKIIQALSNQDPTVRLAAVTALADMNTSRYSGSQTTLDAAFTAFLGCLADDDHRVVAVAARRLPVFVRPEAPLALIATLDRIGEPAGVAAFLDSWQLQSTLVEAIKACLVVDTPGTYEQFSLSILNRLSAGPPLNPPTAAIVLELVVDQYMTNRWYRDASHPEDSPVGHALVSFGPAAGAQLIETAARVKGPRAARAAAFGKKITKGTACGESHVLDAKCVCKKCGVTKHSFRGRSCVCTRCGVTEHTFEEQDYKSSEFWEDCYRCGVTGHKPSGGVGERS